MDEPPPGLPDRLTVDRASAHGRSWLLSVEELGDRAAAESYAGRALLVPRGELPALAEGEFFLHDFVGLEVRDPSGAVLGEVTEVYDTPAQPVLGITVDGRERLVPLRPEFVRQVELEDGWLVVDAPEGLLDI